MATVLSERDGVVLGEPLEHRAGFWIVAARGGLGERSPEGVVLSDEARREQAGDEEPRPLQSGIATMLASSSGCHSKKPEHATRSLQSAHAGAYLRFQSEIEAIASDR